MMNIKRVGMRSYGLGLPAWYYQAALPLGFALIILRYLQHAWTVLRAGPQAKPAAGGDHV
jgi:TRAP-type C4-dicarboxylate transport system permease small subunit